MLHNYTIIVNVVKLIQNYLNSKIQIYSFYRKLVKIKRNLLIKSSIENDY